MKFLDQEKRRQLLNERHSCKMFDSHYEFSSTELEEIAEIARLSPSSYNTQPWHFVMVTDKDLKKQIAAHSYFNEEMIKSASALMVVCSLRPSELIDIDKPSEPFEVIGKIIPRYENENWTFTELLYEAPYLKSYQDDKCVGKVKLRKNWNRYAYIEDIAVCKDFRGQGIGSALINISIEWAKHKNLHGLMLETQDNNLIACKFYHNCGFKIGSVDTMLYANFENNFEKAVFWYLRF